MGKPLEVSPLDCAHGCASETHDSLVDAPAIDLVHLSHQTLGDNALETELLALFDKQSEQFAARLAAPMGPSEGKWRGDLAHTLKGSARSIGAFEVAQAADAYEEAARYATHDLPARWERLDAAIIKARRAIADLLRRA